MDITKEWDKLTDAEKIAYIDNNLLSINPVESKTVSEDKGKADRELRSQLNKANKNINK